MATESLANALPSVEELIHVVELDLLEAMKRKRTGTSSVRAKYKRIYERLLKELQELSLIRAGLLIANVIASEALQEIKSATDELTLETADLQQIASDISNWKRRVTKIGKTIDGIIALI